MAERSKAMWLSCRGLAGCGFESRWRHIFSFWIFRTLPVPKQVNGAVANEIKHVHSPEVIVVLDPRYDISYKAMYISTCSIALTMYTDTSCQVMEASEEDVSMARIWLSFSTVGLHQSSRSKIEVPRDNRNSKGPYTWQVQELMVST